MVKGLAKSYTARAMARCEAKCVDASRRWSIGAATPQ